MLVTILIDAYPKGQDGAIQMANAIDEICHPDDGDGFASTGVYSFWDFITREILYIGYTNDFHRRFMEHNGMGEYDPKFSKWHKVQEHFEREDFLGFSMFVQSAMDQPLVGANRASWLSGATAELLEAMGGQEGDSRVKKIEGALIQAHFLATGKRPAWNEGDASLEGRGKARVDHFEFVLNMAGIPSILNSRYTIRELARDAAACGLEMALHAARMECVDNAVMRQINHISPDDIYRELTQLDPTRAKLYDELDYSHIPFPFAGDRAEI